MRIQVITHNLPRFAGDFSGSFIHALCKEFVAQGAETSVVAPHDAQYDRSLSRPYRLRTFRYAWPATAQTVGYMRSMVRDLQPRPASVLVTPLMLASGTIACLREAREFQPDVLHAHWLLPNGLIGAAVSSLTGIPLVVSIPGSDLLIARLNSLTRSLARLVFNRASFVTANSHELRNVALTLGASRQRFGLVIYGVDAQALKPDHARGRALRQQLSFAESEFVVLAVGRMVPKKGFTYLIQALPYVLEAEPSSRLVFIGDGPGMSDLRQLSQELHVAEKVLFAGTVRHDRISDYYNAADVLVMPSVNEPEDGLNVCVLDAMACGKPIVATTVAGNPLVVKQGTNGYLVPERRPDLLGESLARLATDRETRERFGRASRSLVENEFSWPHIAARYLQLFRRLAPPRDLSAT